MKLRMIMNAYFLSTLFVFMLLQWGIEAEPNQEGQRDVHELLKMARNPPVLESWARLNGHLRHKGSRGSIKHIPIDIRAHLTEKGITAQVIFNEQERYLITQKFNGTKDSTEVIQQKEATENQLRIEDVGLHPTDITLSFLYWNFEQEYPSEKVRGQACRVIRLRDPNDAKFVKLWLSTKYHFPLRVRWHELNDRTPFRTLDFTGFEKVNEAWIIKELKITGEGWKTIVKLKNNTVELVTPTNPLPGDFFVN